MGDTLRFNLPPVREVTLSILIQPLAKLQTLDLAPLRVEWQNEYPILEEVAPLSPWGPDGSDSVQFVRSGRSWPMPLCSFSTSGGGRKIMFQHDRFALSWSFEDAGNKYPGFEALMTEICDKFSRFETLVKESSGISVKPMRVDVEYVNHLAGIPAHGAMAGILSGWKEESRFPFRNPDYCGFRVHYCESEENPLISVLVGVDSIVGDTDESEIPSSSSLTLSAEADISESANHNELLASAHDVLVTAFRDVTSEKMRREWGEGQ
ncbi:TIGR04255 family protein [Kitasatospora sp. NPDC096140]|uniref:TIGR04255 family protein n=1 Tax=Kitasatospora sp. NPDC096140 TaxID=3155425 RepID=UPI0033235BB1